MYHYLYIGSIPNLLHILSSIWYVRYKADYVMIWYRELKHVSQVVHNELH